MHVCAKMKTNKIKEYPNAGEPRSFYLCYSNTCVQAEVSRFELVKHALFEFLFA